MTELTPSADAPQPGASPATQARAAQARATMQRRLLWSGALLLALILAVGAVWWNTPPEMHGILLQSPRVADDFTLQGSTGAPVSLNDLRGKYVVVFFGYTFCPDVCPITLNELQRLAQTLGPTRMQEVQVVMISVDPERDTPEQLASYLRYFDPSFLGLTGTVPEIQAVAAPFGIFFERHEGSVNTGYLVDHTSSVTVIDPEGYVRMIFPHGVSGEDMAQDLLSLMRRG